VAENESQRQEPILQVASDTKETEQEDLVRRNKRKRPKWLPLLIVLTVILGTTISILLIEFGARWPNGLFTQTEPFPRFTPNDTVPTVSLPSAQLGGNATLSIAAASEEQLSLQEIYQKAIGSVVSIVGDQSTGTGIIFDSRGYILTNYHVVEGNTTIEVRLQDGRHYEAALVGEDEKSDLAVLKVEGTGFQAAEFGDSDALQVGDVAVAIGDPLGVTLHGTMTDGIISAINRNVTVDGRVMTLIQTNAALNAGNSGGPLLNSAGQVVGINNMKMISLYSSVEGLGFAIPMNIAKPLVDEIIQNGSVQYTAIGIHVRGVTQTEAEEADGALLVVAVDTHSDAYRQGLRAGDRILAVNGEKMETIDALEAAKTGLKVGDTLEVTVLSPNGAKRTVRIALVDEATLEETE
jgi:serine protease Do